MPRKKTVQQLWVRIHQEIAETGVVSGEAAFLLHDTYGVHVELLQMEVEKQGASVDLEGYRSLMEKKREENRQERKERMAHVG